MTSPAFPPGVLRVAVANLEYGGLSETGDDTAWHRPMACLRKWVCLLNYRRGRDHSPCGWGWWWLRSLLMAECGDLPRDLGSLVVPAAGAVAETGDLWEPCRLLSPDGERVEAVAEFLRDLQAAGRPVTTQRSYALALLRWFRFIWAVEVCWDQVTRAEARDFCRWLQLAGKPGRLPSAGRGGCLTGSKYAASTAAHCETVCRGFYAYHLEAGTGPIVNPFPMARPGRANAHRNPMDPFPRRRAGLFRPRVPGRIPQQIPDDVFNGLFARLGSHRDRALVAFWVSPARAPPNCSACCAQVPIRGSR